MSVLTENCLSLRSLAFKGLDCDNTWLADGLSTSKCFTTSPLEQIKMFIRSSALQNFFNLLSRRADDKLIFLQLVLADAPDSNNRQDVPRPSLSFLHSLCLEGELNLHCQAIARNSLPHTPNLNTAQWFLSSFVEDASLFQTLFEHLTHHVCSNAPSLDNFIVTSYHYEEAAGVSSPPIIPPATLQILATMPNMVQLEIDLEIHVQVTASVLDSFIHAWSHQLEWVSLSPCPHTSLDPSDILLTLQDTVTFASQCPCLHSLGIVFLSTNETVDLHPPVSTALKTFTVGSSPISNSKYLTEVLRRSLPELETLNWADPEVFKSADKEWDKLWEEVERELGLNIPSHNDAGPLGLTGQ
jgi:hypothetical protein